MAHIHEFPSPDAVERQHDRWESGTTLKVIGEWTLFVTALMAVLVPNDIMSGVSVYTWLVLAIALISVACIAIGAYMARDRLMSKAEVMEIHGRDDISHRRAA
jgi:hypothetical protein